MEVHTAFPAAVVSPAEFKDPQYPFAKSPTAPEIISIPAICFSTEQWKKSQRNHLTARAT